MYGDIDALPDRLGAAPQTGRASRPRVILLTEFFPPALGGSPVLFEAIYSRLDSSEVLVLADASSSAAVPGMTSPAQPQVMLAPLRTAHWGLANLSGLLHHLRVARRVKTLANGGRVVVHCGRALPEGVAAWLGRLMLGPPFVVWAHGEDITTALGSRELTLVMGRVYAAAAAVVANSDNTRALLESIGVPSARIRVVHPGVDPRRFHPAVDGSAVRRRYAGEGDTLLLSVGRHQRRKGHDHAIEAVARLRQRIPGLRYLITGNGDQRPRLEAMVRERGLEDRVFFTGELSPPDLPAYYAASDIFLHPNRIDAGDVEGFGIVFLEAAASGKPTIGGRSGGVPEAVEDGVTGRLVAGTDLDELAGVIEELASSPDLRARMGTAGRRRVLERFTWERAARAIDALQSELVPR